MIARRGLVPALGAGAVSDLQSVVIVGGGLAALRAAERLAERGFRGHLDVISGEPHLPYRRPALSEGLLTGQLAPRDLRLEARMPERTRWSYGVHAVGLDREARRVRLSDRRSLPYDGLIVATGLRPRRLPAFDEIDASLVHAMHTVDDALRFRRAARRARRVLIVGGGLIGSEVAAALVGHGIAVTLIDPFSSLLHRALGPHIGGVLTGLHRRRGVDVRLGARIASVERGTRGVVANLTDDTVVRADAALVVIGAVPEVGWMRGHGLDVERGVSCEPTLHAIGADDIVAAGDCARWPNLRFGGGSRGVEQWVTTTLMAQHAADALLAGRDHARAFTPLTWGWTEQWGVRVQAVGIPQEHHEHRVIDGDPTALRGACALHDELGRLTAGVSLDRPAATLRLVQELNEAWPEVPIDAPARWREAGALAIANEQHGTRTRAPPGAHATRGASVRRPRPEPVIPADSNSARAQTITGGERADRRRQGRGSGPRVR